MTYNTGGPLRPKMTVDYEMECPYCGNPAEFIDSIKVYKTASYGMIWACLPCDARVGVHKQGDWEGEPLGTLADADTREARKQAHLMFDRLWKHGDMTRTQAYSWLQKKMLLLPGKCHIARFTVEQCDRVVKMCLARHKSQEKTA